MKHFKLKTGIVAMALIALTASSCKDNKKEHENNNAMHTEMNEEHHMDMNHDSEDHHHDASTAREISSSTDKNGATSEIIDGYLQIKNGLVNDDKDAAAKGGSMMLTAFSNFDMAQLSEEQHKEYMEILESAKEQAEHIVKSPLDHQREHFETLSTDINDLISLLGTDKTLYQDYCPMVKASWLSETKDIKNPYYGSKMLTCGSVKKQIN